MMLPLFAGLALLQSASMPDYVPDTGWGEGRDSSFYESWFGNQLKAMSEPTLADEADLAGYSERFRLLVLPTFAPAYAYRIDVRQDKQAVLNWVRLNGRGGYAPGRSVRQGSRGLSKTEFKDWRQAVANAKLNTLPQDEQLKLTITNDGVEEFIICVDGTQLVFEHLSAHGRDYVVRHCNIEESLQSVLNVVSQLKPRNRMN